MWTMDLSSLLVLGHWTSQMDCSSLIKLTRRGRDVAAPFSRTSVPIYSLHPKYRPLFESSLNSHECSQHISSTLQLATLARLDRNLDAHLLPTACPQRTQPTGLLPLRPAHRRQESLHISLIVTVTTFKLSRKRCILSSSQITDHYSHSTLPIPQDYSRTTSNVHPSPSLSFLSFNPP